MRKRRKLNKEKLVIACKMLGKNSDDYSLLEGYYYRMVLSDEEFEKVCNIYNSLNKIEGKVIKHNGEEKEQCADKEDKLYAQLKQRYTEKELQLLSKGEGLEDRNLSYPKIHLHGKHHRIGIISDTHYGSKYTPEEWTLSAFQTFHNEGCECVLHCGDVTDGLCSGRAKTHIYELSHIGYDAQKDYAIRMLSQCKLPMYILGGNHDNWYKDLGADIVRDICEGVQNATYIGNNQADIFIDGITIRLFHGLDGNSYAVSYRMQKAIESYSGGNKPNILLLGHCHKMCYLFERNIQAVSIPSLQAQTPWMAGKKISAHTGFIIIDFDVFEGGVCNFSVKLYPFYG